MLVIPLHPDQTFHNLGASRSGDNQNFVVRKRQSPDSEALKL